jgi:CRP/FNR family transcriptional regulator, anaerobic regulatory protein
MTREVQALQVRPLASVQPLRARPGSDDRSRLSDLLQLMGCGHGDIAADADAVVPLRRLHAGDPLFHEGALAEAVHFVRGGTFKTYRTAEDGYEQVLGFAGRTELLGFDAIGPGRHPSGAVALEESSVYALRTSDLLALGQGTPALARAVMLAISRALMHSGDLADLMAAVAAEVRLARFLVQWSARMEACGQSPRRFHLRMSRRDIASHLGVAHETVSRSFRALSDWSLLRVCNREIEILDMAALRAYARNTRRHADEAVHPNVGHADLLHAEDRERPVAAPARVDWSRERLVGRVAEQAQRLRAATV